MENEKSKKNSIADEDKEHVFGNNDLVKHISDEALKEREASGKHDPDSHYRDIANEADRTRNKLNEKLNEVRDYGADARETTL